AHSILGRRGQQLLGVTFRQLQLELQCSDEIEHGINSSGELTFKFDQSSDTDQVRKVEYQSRALNDPNGESIGTALIFQDITHLRSVEEQLAVQERLARLMAEGH